MARASPTTISLSRPGPKLAFDEVPGLGPAWRTHAFDLHVAARRDARPRPGRNSARIPARSSIGAAPGVSCFGPAYEYAMILDTDLRRRGIRDKVPMTYRHLRALYRPSRPRRRRRHEGHARIGLPRPRHQMDHQRQDDRGRAGPAQMRPNSTRTARSRKSTKLPFKFAMMMPAFKGVDALMGDRGPGQSARLRPHRQEPAQSEISECLRRRRLRRDPAGRGDAGADRHAEDRLHDRVHGDGDRAQYRRARSTGSEATEEGTWNAVCLADFGDSGVAFVAQPQIPPRNVNWSSEGRWVHLAKIAYEKYFLRKVRKGTERAGL